MTKLQFIVSPEPTRAQKKGDKAMEEYISTHIRLEKRQYDRLRDEAHETRRSQSDIVREALEFYWKGGRKKMLKNLSPNETWEKFIGNQSRKEFMELSGNQTPEEAAEEYVRVSPMCADLSDDEKEVVIEKLVEHIHFDRHPKKRGVW